MLRFASLSGAVGSAIAVVLGLVGLLLNKFFPYVHAYLGMTVERVFLMFWPASIGLMGLDNATGIGLIFGTIFLILTNALLYFLLGAMLWYGAARHKAFLIAPIVIIAGLWSWVIRIT
jgi:hypothetical protein